MSSSEEDHNDGDDPQGHPRGSKKRRIQRACDFCRKKKTRCDGLRMPGNRCSHCMTYGVECSYVEASKRRLPSKEYVEALEIKLRKLEKLLRRFCPDELTYQTLMNTLDQHGDALENDLTDPSVLSSVGVLSGRKEAQYPTLLDSLKTAIQDTPEELPTSPTIDDDDAAALFLSDTFKELSLDYRHFGRSSGAQLIKGAVEAKARYIGSSKYNPVMRSFRHEFWTLQDWEQERHFVNPPCLEFPEPDLAVELINNYFRRFNDYLPLLHRPTFEGELKQRLHLESRSFAAVYLLVCALGARYSDDPRVLLPRDPRSHSAGWKYFEQVVAAKTWLMTPPKLYDLQYYPLAAQFLAGSTFQSCWIMTGLGLRVAQDAGIHRRKRFQNLTAQDQLWKRAFWVLLVLDRMHGSSLGRPCGLHDEDFDVDLPVDCDDEYWEVSDTTQCFKQPEGKPSKITAFIFLIKLIRVLSVTLRTVYAIDRSKVLGFTGHSEQTIIVELDSTLNAWVDSLPPDLRWDPNRVDEDLFNQSAFLYSTYYLVQIIVHRPFIAPINKPSLLSFPSLTICTNAARSCTHLINLQSQRTEVHPLVHMSLCNAGFVLLLGLWSGKRTGLSSQAVQKNMEDVHLCMQALKIAEKRWRSAGRKWDMLHELAHAGDLPLPQPSLQASNKRAWGSDASAEDASVNEEHVNVYNGSRVIAGTRRTFKDKSNPALGDFSRHASQDESTSSRGAHAQSGPMNNSSIDSEFQLAVPLNANDLLRLPLHRPFKFSLSNEQQLSGPTSISSQWMSLDTCANVQNGMSASSFSDASFPAHDPHRVTDMSSMTDGLYNMPPSLDPQVPVALPGAPLENVEEAQSLAAPGVDNWYQMAMGELGQGDSAQHQQSSFRQQSTAALVSVDGIEGTDFDFMDPEVMAMWSSVPPDLLMDDWEAYLSTLTEATRPFQGQQNQDGQSF